MRGRRTLPGRRSACRMSRLDPCVLPPPSSSGSPSPTKSRRSGCTVNSTVTAPQPRSPHTAHTQTDAGPLGASPRSRPRSRPIAAAPAAPESSQSGVMLSIPAPGLRDRGVCHRPRSQETSGESSVHPSPSRSSARSAGRKAGGLRARLPLPEVAGMALVHPPVAGVRPVRVRHRDKLRNQSRGTSML